MAEKEKKPAADRIAQLETELDEAAAKVETLETENGELVIQRDNLARDRDELAEINGQMAKQLEMADKLPELPVPDEIVVVKDHKLPVQATAKQIAKAANMDLDDVEVRLAAATRENSHIRNLNGKGEAVYEVYSVILQKWLGVQFADPTVKD